MQVEIIGRPSEMPFLRRKVASKAPTPSSRRRGVRKYVTVIPVYRT